LASSSFVAEEEKDLVVTNFSCSVRAKKIFAVIVMISVAATTVQSLPKISSQVKLHLATSQHKVLVK